MENKLIPLTEFVNRIDELVPRRIDNDYGSWRVYQYSCVRRYAKFLSQPLTLSMFVPCDDEGNVLEEPGSYGWLQNCGSRDSHLTEEDYIECEKYHEAKSKVLFEGFEIDKNYLFSQKTGHDIFFKYPYGWRLDNVSCEIIEDLVRFDLTLSTTALKQIYG